MAKVASKKVKVQPILTGKRKTSVARVKLIPGGEGKIVVNKKPLTSNPTLRWGFRCCSV